MIKQKSGFKFSLFIIVVLIISMSLIALYSASYNKPVYKNIYLTQFLWFIIGLVGMLLVSSINLKKISNYSFQIYLVLMGLLIITLLFGKEIRFTRGWLALGPINFQFSELSKLGTILFLAKYVDSHFREFNKFTDFIGPFAIILLPIFLILMQPDLGATFIYFPALFVMLFLAEANLKYMLYFLVIGIISFVLPLVISYYELTVGIANIAWIKFFMNKSLLYSIVLLFALIIIFFKVIYYFYPKSVWINILSNIILIILISLLFSHTLDHKLKPYQKKRLLVFIDPKIDPYGAGYNIIQSKIAIGSGQFSGKGYLNGSQTQLGFLPEQTTDFIISVIGEEFGWIGMIFILLLYFLLILNSLRTTYNARDTYSALIAGGITTIFMVQIFINLGMTLGIMPITGITLPLLSYGGSSLVTSMISIGLLTNIQKY